MTDEPLTNNSSMILVVGEVKGLVAGLKDTLAQQNLDAAKYRSEQAARDTQGREEFMKIFEGMRNDNTKQTEILQKTQTSLETLAEWQKDVHPKIKILWDAKNRQGGFIACMILIGSAVSGIVMAAIEYFKSGH